MTEWTVTITATTTSVATTARLEQLALLLAPHGAAIAGGALDRLSHDLEVTLTVSPEDDGVGVVLAGAVGVAVVNDAAHSAGLGGLTVRSLEVIDVDEHDRRLAEPAYAELVGISEIAGILGVTRQRASALQTRPGFPQPLQVLASGPVWPRAWIDRFAATWERKGGRPAKQQLPPTMSVYVVTPGDREMLAKGVGDEFTLSDGERVRVSYRATDGDRVTLHLEEIDG